MAAEDILYRSIITIFIGFLTALASILNKINVFLPLLNTYFVLFLFAGIITSLVGMVMALTYRFRNRKPFYDKHSENISQRKHITFVPFLIIGILLVLIGFTFIYYYKYISSLFYITSMAVSITGILLLFIGLGYFIKEVMMKNKV